MYRKLEMPKTAKEGLVNFAQMALNGLTESTYEAQMVVYDLMDDLECDIYQVDIQGFDVKRFLINRLDGIARMLDREDGANAEKALEDVRAALVEDVTVKMD